MLLSLPVGAANLAANEAVELDEFASIIFYKKI
jgi:hypothetical protein